MKNQPLVTISIPTYNSGPFLERCLRAIQSQTYKNIEVNIIDGASRDNTVAIARKFKVGRIITCKDSLLQSRYEGLKISKGEYTLLLDSDQVLEKDAIERAVDLAQGDKYDMLVLEEDVYQTKHWLEKLFQQDRKLVHAVKDFDPYTSVMLPRFYKTTILKQAFGNIPENALKNVGGQDHAIIYFEVWQYTQKVSLLSHGVRHIEPNSIRVMIRKFYRWGKSSVAAHDPRYEELLSRKERFRKGLFSKGLVLASLSSITLLIIKGVPYFAGVWTKKLTDSKD